MDLPGSGFGPELTGRRAAMVLITVVVQLLAGVSLILAIADFARARSGIPRALASVAASTALLVVVAAFWPERSAYASPDSYVPPALSLVETLDD